MNEGSDTLEIISVIMAGSSDFDSIFNYWISASFAVIISARLGRNQFNFRLTAAISLLYFLVSTMFLVRFYSQVTLMTYLMGLLGEATPAGLLDSLPWLGVIRVIMFSFGFLITEYYLWHSYLLVKNSGGRTE